MTRATERYARRLRRLVASARRDGVAFVVDHDAVAVRVVEQADMDADPDLDLRKEGVKVYVSDSCGGYMTSVLSTEDACPEPEKEWIAGDDL